ncbi:hypothetical protein [Paraburkholderia sediminicola]|uniref:hypothetical protein n=1 Tax=Paraburkholderia sediminicola TaxID=458836 RepID=UPI0038BB2367
MIELSKKLQGIRRMLEELNAATDDRFSDLGELGHAVARLSLGGDATVRQLGSITAYLGQDGGVEIMAKIDEISERIDSLIKQVEGRQ